MKACCCVSCVGVAGGFVAAHQAQRRPPQATQFLDDVDAHRRSEFTDRLTDAYRAGAATRPARPSVTHAPSSNAQECRLDDLAARQAT